MATFRADASGGAAFDGSHRHATALSPARYESDLRALSAGPFDVLVVGGGVVGAGIALDAASRGLRVALVEAQDWAAGSSSRSSKLIHGGLRYLEMHEFALVREALRERSTLMRTAPHLVRPIPIMLPLDGGYLERTYLATGVLLYDALARTVRGASVMPLRRRLSKRQTQAMVPGMAPASYTGAIKYWDAQVDDARHTMTLVRTAASHGAVVVSRMKAVGLIRSGERITGARLLQTETGREREVAAKIVISATGVWTDAFAALADGGRAPQVQPSKGIHLMVPRTAIDSEMGLILRTELSVLFVLPWGAHWLIGTTDTAWAYDVGRPAASASDIDYVLATVNKVLQHPLTHADIQSVYVGLRPLVAAGDVETTKLSREHAVETPRPGLVLVSGGKYTTYRSMAEDTLNIALAHNDILAQPCRTSEILLAGGEHFAEIAARHEEFAARWALEEAQVDRLLGRYGSLLPELFEEVIDEPSLLHPIADANGYLRVEIAYAVVHEGARHLDDVMSRRTRLSMEAADRGLHVAAEVAAIISDCLHWDHETMMRELDAYRTAVTAEIAAESEIDDQRAAARLQELSPFPSDLTR